MKLKVKVEVKIKVPSQFLHHFFCNYISLSMFFTDAMDSLEERVKSFFTKCKSSTPPVLAKEVKEEQFTGIKQVSNLIQYTQNIILLRYFIQDKNDYLQLFTHHTFLSRICIFKGHHNVNLFFFFFFFFFFHFNHNVNLSTNSHKKVVSWLSEMPTITIWS